MDKKKKKEKEKEKKNEKEVARKKDLKDAPHDQDNLDEGLEESMDGSDPPSAIQP